MTFGITLPFINTRLYQRYQITTFAVPMNDMGLRARVQVENDITLDTQDGYWFVPTLCVGHRPQLCRAGPKWKDSYPCERGLVTGHLPDREQCVIISTTTNKTTAQEVSEGQFVVQTLGEDIKLACHGRDQEQATLMRGIYSFLIGEGCVLSGERWALHGLVRRYLTAKARVKSIKIPPFDLAAVVDRQSRNNAMKEYQVHLDLPMNSMSEPHWQSMDNDGYPEVVIAHHLSWTAIGFIVILCILCIITAVWLYRRRQKIRFFFADALLTKVKARQMKMAVKYDTKEPEVIKLGENVESATGEVETV